ncbi:uncharacterized protein [Dendropsophus ebraccatus]|uniref:uncharacterized protein isoform X2 n=1 Tax=Dendropsophus ebraccatus TaxID=150705 RepID=UPI003831EF40
MAFSHLNATTFIPTKDFQAGLDRNEKTFQAKMLEIFKKFDHPFVNDYIVNIEDFTFETPQGRRKWNFEINMSENVNSDRVVSAEHIQETEDFEETNLTESENSDRVVSAEHIQETEDFEETNLTESENSDRVVSAEHIQETENFEETNLTESEDEHSSDQACTISMECEEDHAYYDGRREWNFKINTSEDVNSDRVVSAEHIQETENFEDTNLTESEDEHSSDQACTISMECEEDNAYYDGRREWNFKINTSEDVNSDRVVSAEHIQETENFEETNLTESEDEHSSDQACTILMECEEDNAYCDDREKPVSTQNSGSSVRSMITSVGLPLKAQGYRLMKSKENDVKSPGRYNAAICAADDSGSSENAGKSYCGLNKKVLGNWATCIDSTLSRKNSEFTMSQSPKTALAKLNYNKGERTLIPRKDMTTRSWIDTDGTIYKKFRENTKDLQNRTCAVVNRNSFSAHFSEHHREHADFESLYRDLTQGRPQPVLPQGKAPVQLSQTFFPSVNSPGSQRAKRPLCDDYSSSLSKIPRSLTEAINQRSNFVDGSDMLWSGSCSSPLQQHKEVAASLPAHMLPSSPMSLRSSSPGVNARSPKRTNARKLSFKGKNGSSTGN